MMKFSGVILTGNTTRQETLKKYTARSRLLVPPSALQSPSSVPISRANWKSKIVIFRVLALASLCSRLPRPLAPRNNSRSSQTGHLPTPPKQNKVIFTFKKKKKGLELRHNDLITDTVHLCLFSIHNTTLQKFEL